MKAIFERRSVRDFVNVPVSDKLIHYLIKTAMNAPNAGHQRPWEFVVVRDEKVLKSLSDMAGYENDYNNVDASIVVCINKSRLKWDGYWQMDTGTAVENMMIAATNEGYGTLWLEVFPVEEKIIKAQEILSLPDDVIPMMVMPIGKSRSDDEREPVFIESQIHYNQWETK